MTLCCGKEEVYLEEKCKNEHELPIQEISLYF